MMETPNEPAKADLLIYPRRGFGVVVRDEQISPMCQVLKSLDPEMAQTWRDHAVWVKQGKEVKDACNAKEE